MALPVIIAKRTDRSTLTPIRWTLDYRGMTPALRPHRAVTEHEVADVLAWLQDVAGGIALAAGVGEDDVASMVDSTLTVLHWADQKATDTD